MTDTTPKESIRALLSGIVDYAGLFPPSALSMAEAVSNYATYTNSNYNWMLGRFVVPLRRLPEFLESGREYFPREKNDVWRLSVLASDNISETIRQIEEFNDENAPNVVCDSIEIKADTSWLIEDIAEFIPPQFAAYFEIPLNEDLADMVATLAINGQRAKIRTGGVTADAFPKAEQIIRFMRTCLAANVPIKATAGLHHPLRCFQPLTYETDAPEGTMNGFLNVFLATGFLRQGYKPQTIAKILNDEAAESFTFNNNGVWWQKECFISSSQLRHLREKNIISFGSCSFEEPIADLQNLKLL